MFFNLNYKIDNTLFINYLISEDIKYKLSSELDKQCSDRNIVGIISYNQDKHTINFEFDYNKKIIDSIKGITGRHYNEKTRIWSVKLGKNNYKELLLFLKFNDFKYDQKLLEDIKTLHSEVQKDNIKYQENIILSKAKYPSYLKTSDIKGLADNFVLKPFQLAGLEYMELNDHILIGDEMGLGKTIESICYVQYKQLYPVIIVTPNSLKYNWFNEYKKIIKDDNIDPVIITSKTKCLPLDIINDHKVIIISYNTVSKFKKTLKKMLFKSIIIDESHHIKNKNTQRTQDIKEISKKCSKRILLSGTPIVNRPAEIVTTLQFLDILDLFGGWQYFVERYCEAKKEYGILKINGASNLMELNEKLRMYGYLRREKKDVLDQLPDKQRQVVELDIDNEDEYNSALNNIQSYMIHEIYNEVNEHTELNKEDKDKLYRKLKHERITKLLNAEFLVRLNKLRQLSAKGKLRSAIEWINDFLEKNNKLVLFGVHTDILKTIADVFECNIIIGETKPEDRQKYIEDFQNNPNTKLLILNIATGNVGYTLTASSNVACIELDWNPGVHLQAEDRVHRIGQKELVNCFYLIGKGTIDYDMYNVLETKMNIINQVNKGIIDNSNMPSIKSIVDENFLMKLLE